ncbi:MAG: single-stranded DNA-binding protein [Clostridiaceae bacterium]|nr:single-stranded DNA-binding protein [Clostridiaceae bacterium]
MLNSTHLQGRLTADPELRYTPGGTAVASFTLASDTGRKTKDGNRITNFIDCVAWRNQAEFASKYLTKGRLIIAEGELTSRSYEDRDGNRRKATELTVDQFHFCDSKKDNQNAGHAQQGSDSSGPDGFSEVEGDDGDLPF